MTRNLPEGARSAYARQLADEAKTLVPGMERLAEIAAELRADDLYRTLGFDTWERFCTDYLGVSKRTANRWIAGPEPKSIAAGQRVAAGQNVPVVESPALKSSAPTEAPAKQSEGSGPGKPQTRPGVAAPSDPSPVGGNALGEVSAPPTAVPPEEPCCDYRDHSPGPCACPDHDEQTPLHPFGGMPASPPQRPPTDRALTARVFAAMREVDPTDAGSATTPEEATFLRQWAQRTLDAWKAKNVPTNGATAYQMMADQHDGAKPQRQQGTITRPQAAVIAGRAVTVPARPLSLPRSSTKRHADDCSCLSCASPKAAKA